MVDNATPYRVRERAFNALVAVVAAPYLLYLCVRMALAWFHFSWWNATRPTWEDKHRGRG